MLKKYILHTYERHISNKIALIRKYTEKNFFCSSIFIYFNILDFKKSFLSLKINYFTLANIYLNQGI
jgi:hypothetical protein